MSQIPEHWVFFHKEDPLMDLQEAGILVLGIISDEDGCLPYIEPHLSQLVSYLVQQLQSESTLIRSTSLWSLQKVSSWTAQTLEQEQFT